jgi:hypothetical protein
MGLLEILKCWRGDWWLANPEEYTQRLLKKAQREED